MRLFKLAFSLLSLLCISISGTALAEDCLNLETQKDLNQCASFELKQETNQLNKTYQNYRNKLNQNQKQKFKNVQLAWIKFKDLACQFESSGVESGSAYSMVMASCLAEKTRQRNKEIETLNNCQEGDLSCPAW